MRRALVALLAGASTIACGSGGDPESYARQVADETAPKRGPSKINVFEPPVPRGKHVACDDLLDAGALRRALGKPVALIDKWNPQMAANAVCIAVHRKTAAEHRAAGTRADDAIGKTVGLEDALCRIEAACFDPLDEAGMQARCEREIPGGEGTRLGGTFACLATQSTKDRNSKLMESGRVEHLKFQITAFEPDTTCQLTIYALDDESLARSCAAAALDTVTAESIERFQ